MQLSEYSLECLRDDGEFTLHRGHANQPGLLSVLLLTPASTHPSPETLKKIDHEYSLETNWIRPGRRGPWRFQRDASA